MPWCIGGNFKVILYPEEKLGGLPHTNSKSFDFMECMNSCGMTDIGDTGSKYTWCKNWRPCKRIWKRLDRVFINDLWAQKYSNNIVKHIARTGSDHRPILLKCNNGLNNSYKYFKFLDFWTTHSDFKNVVSTEWSKYINGNPMWRLQDKLKRLGKRLTQWSREKIGDVNEQAEIWEAKVQYLEDLDIINRTEESRQTLKKGHVEHVYWLSKQDSLLKQKARTRWFEEGDSNNKYFHFVIRERRRRLCIQRIKNKKGKWISGDEKIGKAVVKHYEHMFNLTPSTVDPNILEVIPECITYEDNINISKCPQEDEIREAVFDMNPDSAAGPDGFSGTISNVWHSIILNRTIKGFFTSTQVFKQGDPLSPSLFIIGAEVLSRLLNNLIHSEHFLPFSMPVRGPVINHLSYADGIVIFTSGNTKSIRMIMKQIHRYGDRRPQECL
ncbi:uncharacterized protein LOC107871219 isoform X2 [Capsicum annuum]|uniref:uncharacterized protein LOC107871219 isoform X2 n=1 Tax=Capsicum annuum TaxID=4072 RepID=UPI0007BF3623|nr:uncharacterized protein LOC107871219 isoform X2 [Capsicum annuum]